MTLSDRPRVLLVDDHVLFRKGLISLLSSLLDMQVVGEADDGPGAVEMARRVSPDLILMDVHMPGGDGIQAVDIIKREAPHCKIVMLSASDDNDDLFMAIRAGADGYLLKTIEPARLVADLEGIRRGEAPISGVLADHILCEFRKTKPETEPLPGSPETLTPRETATLELLVQGKSNREIADALYVSENTVRIHLHNIMEKLHLANRIQVVAYALRQGLVDNSPSG